MKRFAMLVLAVAMLFALLQSAQAKQTLTMELRPIQASEFAGKSVENYWKPIFKQCGTTHDQWVDIRALMATPEAREQVKLICFTNNLAIQAGQENWRFWSGSKKALPDAGVQVVTDLGSNIGLWPPGALR